MTRTRPRPDPTGDVTRASAAIRVASVPASHVYVRHLAHPDGGDRVVRLPDVPPPDGRTVPGGWWPPVMLDAAWIRSHREDFDVFHVHFGFDAKTTAELEAVVAALDEAGAPLVVTVHDLRNPHHSERATHDAQLGVLLRGATSVVTLTPGAAREIERRWGLRARVLPHPHVVEPDRVRRPRPLRDGVVFGLHAKSVRANMAPVPVARALVDVVGELPGARLRIDLHDELLDPSSQNHDPATGNGLLALGVHPHVDLAVHPYFSDDELWDYLEAIDVSVLPYRFGTHSGWLEACRDLGTAVVAPDCGFYGEQQPCEHYVHGEEGLDVTSLREAARRSHAARVATRDLDDARRALAVARREERRAIAAAHEALYRRALGD